MSLDPMLLNREIEMEQERLQICENKMQDLEGKVNKGGATREQIVANSNDMVNLNREASKHRQRIMELSNTLTSKNKEVMPSVPKSSDEPPVAETAIQDMPETPNTAPKRPIPDDPTPAKRPYVQKAEMTVTGAEHQMRIFPQDAAPDTDTVMTERAGSKRAKIGQNTFSDEFVLLKEAGGATATTASDYYVQTAASIVKSTQQTTKPNRLCCISALSPVNEILYEMQTAPFTLVEHTYGEKVLLLSFEEVSIFDIHGGVIHPTLSRRAAASAVLGWNTLPRTPYLNMPVVTSPLSRTLFSPPSNLQMATTSTPVVSCPALSLEAKNNATWGYTLCSALTGSSTMNDKQKENMSNLFVPLKTELSSQLSSFTAPAFKGFCAYLGIKTLLGALTMCEAVNHDEMLHVQNSDVLPGTNAKTQFINWGIDLSQPNTEVFHSVYTKVVREQRVTWSRADPSDMSAWVLSPSTIVLRCYTNTDVRNAVMAANFFWAKSLPMYMQLPRVPDKTVPNAHTIVANENWYTTGSADVYADACRRVHLIISPGINLDDVLGPQMGDANNIDTMWAALHCNEYSTAWDMKVDAGFIFDLLPKREYNARVYMARLESALTLLYTQKCQSPIDFNTAMAGALQTVMRSPVAAAWHRNGQPHYGNPVTIDDVQNMRFGLDGVPSMPVVNLERCYTFTLDTRRMVCAAEFGYAGQKLKPLPSALVAVLNMSVLDLINGVAYASIARSCAWSMHVLELGLTEQIMCHVFSNADKQHTIGDITRNSAHATYIQKVKLEVLEKGMSTWVPRINKQLADNFALPSTLCDGILTMASSIAPYLRKTMHMVRVQAAKPVSEPGFVVVAQEEAADTLVHASEMHYHDMVFHGIDLAWTAEDIMRLETETLAAVFAQHLAVYNNPRGMMMFMKDTHNMLTWEPCSSTKVDLREWSSMGRVPGTYAYSFTDMVSDKALATRDKIPAMLDIGTHGLLECIDQAASWLEWTSELAPRRRTVPRGNPITLVRSSKADRRDLTAGLLTPLRSRVYSNANVHRNYIYSQYPMLPEWIDVPHKTSSMYLSYAFSFAGALIVPNISSRSERDFGAVASKALMFMRADGGYPLLIRKPRDAHAYQPPDEDVISDYDV